VDPTPTTVNVKILPDTVIFTGLVTPIPLVNPFWDVVTPEEEKVVAVIVPALKFPEASLATIALLVLALVAVVALLDTLPAVEIVASLVSTIPADALISALTIAPVAIAVAVPVEVISPVRLGILVVDVAVPVSEPKNIGAVTSP
jgi:hypothetical protein